MLKLFKRAVEKIVTGLSPKVSGTTSLPHKTEQLIDLNEIWDHAIKANGRSFVIDGVEYREVDRKEKEETPLENCKCYYCRNYAMAYLHGYVYHGDCHDGVTTEWL